MMRTFLAAVLFGACASSVFAQIVSTATNSDASQSGVVRGSVTANLTNEHLSHALVTITSLGLQQFSNNQGKFYFAQVKPGKYMVNVRQLGYLPTNVEVIVRDSTAAELAVRMNPIARTLATIRVAEQQLCETPGRPTLADGAQIVEMFEQLEQSALRLALLAREYPYHMQVKREMFTHAANGRVTKVRSDALTKEGQQNAAYQPGKVITRLPGNSGNYSFEIPSLFDFADNTFIANHCFTLNGYETVPREGGKGSDVLVRIDITAAERLTEADVEGSVFLDSADYRLRRSELRVSKLPSALGDLSAVRATTTFNDVMPGMPAIKQILARTEGKAVKGPPSRVQSRSEQQLVTKIVFTKQKPDGTGRSPGNGLTP